MLNKIFRSYVFFILSVIFSYLIACSQTFADEFSEKYNSPVEFLTIWEEDYGRRNVSAPYADLNAPKGGSIRLGVTGTFDNFNPFAKRGRVGAYFGFVYETLGETAYTDDFEFQGLIAKNFRIAKDRYSMIINLREEAHFSDGVQITADDVVFSFNALIKDASPQYKTYYEHVKSVEALNKHSVLITFKNNTNRELPLIICQLPVLPKHWWEGKNLGEPQVESMPASGPYKLKEFKMGSRIVYERDKNYWAKDLINSKGLYNFDSIEINYYRDAAVSREAFFAGELDFYSEGTIKDWKNAYDVPPVLDGRIIKKEKSIEMTRGSGVFMNTRSKTLVDKRVRKALIQLFDFEWVNRSLLYDSYSQFSSFYAGELSAPKLPSEKELEILNKYKDKLESEVFGALPEIPVTDGSGRNRDGYRKALALFKEADWNLVDGKLINAQNEQFTINMMISTQSLQRIYLHYQKTLERIGIVFNLQLVDTTQYIERIRNFDYDMIQLMIRQSEQPGNEQRMIWGSDGLNERAQRNYAGVNDPVIDEMIEHLVLAKSRSEWVVYANIMDRLLQHGYYTIYPWATPNINYAWWKDKISPPNQKEHKNGIDIISWHKPNIAE